MWMCDAELRRRSLDDFMRGVRDLERENDSLLLHVLGASILYARTFFCNKKQLTKKVGAPS